MPGARVVIAGGEGARGIPGLIAKPHFDSPDALRRYVLAEDLSTPYNPMNAIGVSKLLSAIWSMKLAEIEGEHSEVIWFSPGLTYGTAGLGALKPAARRWFVENVVFNLMRALGKAQSPADGARKYADCLERKVGESGAVIGAPEGKALGALVDQRPMNEAFDDAALREELWSIMQKVCGPLGRDLPAVRGHVRSAVA